MILLNIFVVVDVVIRLLLTATAFCCTGLSCSVSSEPKLNNDSKVEDKICCSIAISQPEQEMSKELKLVLR